MCPSYICVLIVRQSKINSCKMYLYPQLVINYWYHELIVAYNYQYLTTYIYSFCRNRFYWTGYLPVIGIWNAFQEQRHLRSNYEHHIQCFAFLRYAEWNKWDFHGICLQFSDSFGIADFAFICFRSLWFSTALHQSYFWQMFSDPLSSSQTDCRSRVSGRLQNRQSLVFRFFWHCGLRFHLF